MPQKSGRADRLGKETSISRMEPGKDLFTARNVTDRHLTERRSHQYERILSISSDGISLVDCNYIYQFVNDTYLRYNNKRREEIEGCSVSELLGKKVFLETVKPRLDACFSGETVQYEAWFNFAAIGQQFVRVTYSPYREADRTITGAVVCFSLITDRKVAERALQESELRFRGIFDQMYQFIGLLSPDGILLEANRSALAICGSTRNKIVGKPLEDTIRGLVSETVQDQFHSAIAQAAQGNFVRYEVDMRGKQGQIMTIDFSLRPIFNDEGQVVLLIPEGRDISDRKKAEKQLQLQAIITRNMAEGICLVRIDNGSIVYANPKFERLFGYEPDELSGQHISILNYQDSSGETARQLIAEILRRGEHTYEAHNVKKDGSDFWCEATTSVFDHPDYGRVLVTVQQDISDRKEAQEQEKMRAALREKELLLKEIYHRVKNNLQVIYSLLNLQSRNLSDPLALAVTRDSQCRVKAMALVHEKLCRSQSLACIDLADYAKSLVHSLLETYCLEANKVLPKINISDHWLDTDTALPCGLILTELVSNSLKYAFPSGQNGTITVTSSDLAQDQIILIIKDDGVGLPSTFNLETTSSLLDFGQSG
ncbi:PAS domain S-box protein [Oscillatoria sp. CS-180]|uniref:PAS domain S-box protein n=1 Tax=Oscillatoria sp. CS-180 TaxID=3021720 RepID=UPI00232C8D8B|nr:PAS domain S-box protein [Oscillatoria sp. CS-180]